MRLFQEGRSFSFGNKKGGLVEQVGQGSLGASRSLMTRQYEKPRPEPGEAGKNPDPNKPGADLPRSEGRRRKKMKAAYIW
jgi:hypothetical protein